MNTLLDAHWRSVLTGPAARLWRALADNRVGEMTLAELCALTQLSKTKVRMAMTELEGYGFLSLREEDDNE